MLVLYHRVYEGPGFREYLQRSTEGQQAAWIRFQLRLGTSMLRQHDSQFRDQASHDTEDRICPVYEHPRGGFTSGSCLFTGRTCLSPGAA